MILVGFLLKLAVYPFSMWAPDVCESISYPLLFILMVVMKVALLFMLMRVVLDVFREFLPYVWSLIYAAGLSSIVIGALGAFKEEKIKRFIAFSSINQMGYILFGITHPDVLATGLFYTFFYILANIVFIGILAGLHNPNTGGPVEYITELRGLKDQRYIPIFLTFSILSIAGLPPTIGFFAKFYLISGLMLTGSLFAPAVILVVSVLSCYYYVRLIEQI